MPWVLTRVPPAPQTFTNVSRIVVLKATADALCEECYTRFVVPDGAALEPCARVRPAAPTQPDAAARRARAGVYDGHKVRPKDVIRLERGGTGFAATSKVEASTYTLLGVGSGAQGGRCVRVCAARCGRAR